MPDQPGPISRRRFGLSLALATAGVACNRLNPNARLSGISGSSPTGGEPARAAAAGDPPPPPSNPGPARDPTKAMPENQTTPVAFISHGAPTLATDPAAGADLRRWGQSLTRPTAVVVISAHWQTAAATIGTTTTRELIYDFSGFPDALYRVPYAAPGAPDLARRIAALLGPPGPLRQDEQRGWDHGVWVPLLHLLPDADVPLLQISLPRQSPKALFELGRRLAPLRREGVLVLASGGVTHNLRLIGAGGPTPKWALDFDNWLVERLQTGDIDGLLDYGNIAPALRLAHPTEEHWTPMMVALGAAAEDGPLPKVQFPVTGWEFAHLSRRSVQFG